MKHDLLINERHCAQVEGVAHTFTAWRGDPYFALPCLSKSKALIEQMSPTPSMWAVKSRTNFKIAGAHLGREKYKTNGVITTLAISSSSSKACHHPIRHVRRKSWHLKNTRPLLHSRFPHGLSSTPCVGETQLDIGLGLTTPVEMPFQFLPWTMQSLLQCLSVPYPSICSPGHLYVFTLTSPTLVSLHLTTPVQVIDTRRINLRTENQDHSSLGPHSHDAKGKSTPSP